MNKLSCPWANEGNIPKKQGLSDTVITFQHGVTSLWDQKGYGLATLIRLIQIGEGMA